jgi:hypothetical protein
MNLVTMDEAMDHLRYDDEPPGLDILIEAVSNAVLKYINKTESYFEIEIGSDGKNYPFIPSDIKAACLIWLGELDQNREGGKVAQVDSRFGYGYPPETVVALLAPYHIPRMA